MTRDEILALDRMTAEIWGRPIRAEAEVVREAEEWMSERRQRRQQRIDAARALRAADDGSEKP